MTRTNASRLARTMLCLVLVIALTPTAAFAAWPVDPPRLSMATERVPGASRFAAAANMALAAYPGWQGVTHVVVASGDDRAAADPLSASGLCWAYDAPLLLTSAARTPAETKAALAAIASKNPTVTVTVVGGRASIPSARVNELRAVVPSGTVEQPWTSGSRYSLAARVSARMSAVASATAKVRPNAVFVANGAEAKRFSDALAASAVSRYTGIPVLLAAGAVVPNDTKRALAALGSPETIVIGGTQSITSAAYGVLGGDARWSGANRFGTASEVARRALERGWATGLTAGVAAKVPDALAGAAALGRSGGLVLATETERLPKETWARLRAMSSVTTCTVLGGPASIAQVQCDEIEGSPGRPVLSAPGTYVGKTMKVDGRANSNTTRVALYVGGALIGTRDVTPYGSFDFGSVASPAKSATVEVRASSPDGATCSVLRTVKRLVFPYATCIVIDKSDFKLYWVKNNELVKTYPIAIGRPGMETPVRTWKILAKYHTDPGSVYGPRKMRLFKKSGSGWEFTAYAIHGTNQPWVIGTKASHGCIRMYNSDVLELFPQVPIGTMVVTRE